MNRIITTITLIFFLSTILQSQDCALLKVQSKTNTTLGQNSCLKVALANTGEIQSFQFRLRWNDDFLEYIDHTIISPSDMLVGDSQASSGFFNVSWLDALNPITITDSEELLSICFSIKDSLAEIPVTLSMVELTDPMNNILEVCEYDGKIEPYVSHNSELDLEIIKTDKNCFVQDEGSIKVFPFFGVEPYTYFWSGPYGASGSTTNTVDMLEEGEYFVNVTDVNADDISADIVIIDDVTDYVGISLSQPSCEIGNDGRISVNLIETYPPYEILWSTGFIGPSITGLGEGQYSFTVTDANGCTTHNTLTLSKSFYASIDFDVSAESCPGDNTGSIEPVINNIVNPPLTYAWSNGSTDMNQYNLATGQYTVTIVDAIGCIDFWDIGVPPSPLSNISSVIAMQECATEGQNDGQVSIWVSPSTDDLEIIWHDGQIDSIYGRVDRNDFGVGTYDYTIVYKTDCIVDQGSFDIISGITEPVTDYISCGPDTLKFSAAYNDQFDYEWVPNYLFTDRDSSCTGFIVDYGIDSLPDFMFAGLKVKGPNGCRQSYDISIKINEYCVWPGDVNDDNSATLDDLLFLGLANGSTGPARSVLSTEWIAQESALWNSNIPGTAIDMMHADCNGDGQVNDDDIPAINQNLGLTHNFTEPAKITSKMVDVPLYLSGDLNLVAKQSQSLDLILGEDLNPAIDIHGIVFTIHFDLDILDDISFDTDGWLNTDNTAWELEKIDDQSISVAISRNDGQGISNEGKIGSLNFFVEEISSFQEIIFDISDVLLLDATGTEIPTLSEASVWQVITATDDLLSPEVLTLFPNPFKDQLYIETDLKIEQYQIYSLSGELILSDTIAKNQISLSSLNQGCYLLKVISSEGIASKLIHKL